ncbi:hypothetical protein L0Y49_01180 [bacterium]|nr:hypothetical protein [bacterium]MCI0680172.1 hypothetical protein [bacterium]
MEKTRDRTTQKIFALAIALNVGALSLFGFEWVFLENKIEQNEAMLKELQALSLRDDTTRDLEFFFDNTAEERARLETFFINRESVLDFIEEIESLGRHAGVTLTIESVGKRDDTLEIAVFGEGSFENVLYFSALMEHTPYRIVFPSISFERKKETGNDLWDVRGTIRLISFVDA